MPRPRIVTDIVSAFLSACVLTLDELVLRLSVSRRTVLRRLDEHGYFSSYNHRGRFLTVGEVARFDSRGLWSFREACFSKRGTLKDTVAHFVTASTAGMTHDELAQMLRVRVHNPLLELVNEGAISRARIGPVFVYVSAAPEVREAQVHVRSSAPCEPGPGPTSRQVIAVLLELVGDPAASREDLVVRCQRGGAGITRETLDAVFTRYDLDKKRAR
jgi:hypothetical protein